MRKRPTRKNNEISQGFNDGVCNFYSVADVAEVGKKPLQKLQHKGILRFDEQRLGLNRMYLARQVNAEIMRVIRVPNVLALSPQDVAIIRETQYRIDAVQIVQGIFPACVDVSLRAVEQIFEVV